MTMVMTARKVDASTKSQAKMALSPARIGQITTPPKKTVFGYSAQLLVTGLNWYAIGVPAYISTAIAVLKFNVLI